MICLDSWIWLEYIFEDDKWQDAEATIETANSSNRGEIVPATVVAEVSYCVSVDLDFETVDEIETIIL